jgi:hypothetical protein
MVFEFAPEDWSQAQTLNAKAPLEEEIMTGHPPRYQILSKVQGYPLLAVQNGEAEKTDTRSSVELTLS